MTYFRAILSLLAVLLQVSGQSQPMELPEVFVHEQQGYALGPSTLVAQGRAIKHAWSSNGGHLYLLREPSMWEVLQKPALEGRLTAPPRPDELRWWITVVDVSNGRSRDLLSVPMGTLDFGFIPVPNSSLVALEGFEQAHVLTPTGSRHLSGRNVEEGIPLIPPTRSVALQLVRGSPTSSLAWLETTYDLEGEHLAVVGTVLLTLGSRGEVKRIALPTPSGRRLFLRSLQWQGDQVQMDYVEPKAPEDRQNANVQPTHVRVMVDPRSGFVSPPQRFEPSRESAALGTPEREDPAVHELMARQAQQIERRENGISTYSLVLRSSDPKRRLANLFTGKGWGEVSPTFGHVVYGNEEFTFVRPLLKVDLKMLEEMERARLRSELIQQAKQVGVGLLLYASDHEDNYPAAGANLEELISPYLKNPKLLEGFVYTFQGGNLRDIKDVSNTPIGYIQGPGGRAVVYADTSVRWVND